MKKELAVLLPYYNNINGLLLTLNSLNQESEKFSLFIIDDCSDSKTRVEQMVANFSIKREVFYLRNDFNKGITKTLNDGLRYIQSFNRFSLIARLDAGDVCLNERLKIQRKVLESDPELYLVGSWVNFVDIERKFLFQFKPPLRYNKLKKVIHLYNPFIHPSVMFKVKIIDKVGYYPENYTALEDHAYFFKITKLYKAEIIDKVLLEYEVNPNGISSVNRHVQTKSRIKLFLDEFIIGFYPIIGLIRAVIIHFVPQKILITMKRKFFYA